nr:MAG TPA: hypothetical protein [Caudoviricetes sp.]
MRKKLLSGFYINVNSLILRKTLLFRVFSLILMRV